MSSATSNKNETPKIRALRDVLAEQLYRYKNIEIPAQCWQEQSLDNYYQFNIHVLDERGKLMDQGRDLSVLRERYRDHVQGQLQTVSNDFEQSALTSWSFGALPKTHLLQQNGLEIRVYPGLSDNGDSVDLKLYDNDQEADVNSLRGMVRLAMLNQAQTVKYLRKNLLKNKDIGLTVVDMGNRDHVIDDIISAAVRQTCFDEANGDVSNIDNEQDFILAVERAKGQWVERAEHIAILLVQSLSSVVAIKKQAKQSKNVLTITYAMSDISKQLAGLFYRGCLYSTPYEWLQQYPRYFKAIGQRLEKVPMNVNQDRAYIAQLEPLYTRLDEVLSANNKGNDSAGIFYGLPKHLQQYRWMLEELRVSLFAQALTTRVPVSVKRLNKQWESSTL